MSVRGFCESVGIGRTRFYQEVKTGRLRVRKVGRRTIVTSDDAEDWLNRLPVIQESLHAQRGAKAESQAHSNIDLGEERRAKRRL